MINYLKLILMESNQASCMRFMSLISLLVGSAIAIISLVRGCDINSSAAVVAIFVGAAFGGKVAQKVYERKSPRVKK